ncbi:MAG: hypothetical protein QOD68_2993 [Actinomycetota bacterium]|jgi:hypothetical protein|nr:hypothetical protein [Actinomycetota bacterium]
MRPSDPLLAGLVDDAALFPPGNAPMPVALAEHARYRHAPWSAAIGPFLCPASRIEELVALLPADQDIRVALVNDVTDSAALHARSAALRMTALAWLETRHDLLGEDPDAVAGGSGRTAGAPFAYLEVPRTGFDAALDLVGDAQPFQAAKYRTGGVTPEAFPSERELAAFLVACAARGVPFKLTAGLHHAVRSTTDEGLEQHGLLNVLVATRVAQTGGSVDDVAVPLALRSADPLVGFVEHWDEGTCTGVRSAFRSFGCCGVTDPLGDLATVGLLEDFS